MNRWSIAALVIAVMGSAVGEALQKEQSFPNTKNYGRATVEYNKGGFHVVANYDYAQRNHKSRWLLVDLAMASSRRFVLDPDMITLVTPDGRVLPVAPQQAILDDSAGIQAVIQNAKIWRRPLESYFSQRSARSEAIKFQVLPGGGITTSEVTVDNDHVTLGGLFFRMPNGIWEAGTYRLAIENEVAKAALPIRLE
jgi:hypothetical protein